MIKIHQNPTEIASIWDSAYEHEEHKSPFLGRSWHELYLTTRSDQATPSFLSIDDTLIAPFMLEGKSLIFSGNKEISDYLDIIGDSNKKSAAWEEIITWAKTQQYESLILNNISEKSPSYAYFLTQKEASIIQDDTTPSMQLPDSWDTYTSSLERKNRHELKRKIRKFESAYTDVSVETSLATDATIQTLLHLMKLNPNKAQFLSSSMEKFFTLIPQYLGSLAYITQVIVDTKIAASTLAFKNDDTYFLYNSGFDETAFSGSGFYLKAKTIEWAINQKLSTYNFLQGSERYKYELGGVDSPVYTISLEL